MAKLFSRFRKVAPTIPVANPRTLMSIFRNKAVHNLFHRTMAARPLQYDGFEDVYSRTTKEDLPHSKMKQELIRTVLGDCSGCRILNLGGGSGEHAREAIAAGARHIDVVDTSPALMEIGEDIEANEGRNIIRWILADITRPLNEQAIIPTLQKGSYDIVMAFWSWDTAGTIEQYEEVWRNVSMYLKPGGRVVGARTANPWALSLQTGKYGTVVNAIEQTPGGVQFQVRFNAGAPGGFDVCAMEESIMGDKDFPESVGIRDIQTLKARETELSKKDPDFWLDFVEDPYFVVFSGRKANM